MLFVSSFRFFKNLILLAFVITIFTSLDSNGQEFGPLVPVDRPANYITSVVTIDVNNDGQLDFVVAESTTNQVSWFERIGENEYGQRQVLFESNDAIYQLFALDLDNDGDLDLQLTHSYPGNGSLHFDNLDSGLFAAPIELNPFGFIRDLYFSEEKLDGTRDLVIVRGNSKIEISEGNPDGSFSTPVEIIDLSGDYFGSSLADLDGDGINDLMASIGSSDVTDPFFQWMPGVNSTTFGNPIQIQENADHFAVVDMDQDGDLDVCRASSGSIDWFVNDGGGYYVNTTIHTLYSFSSNDSKVIYAQDMDLDGDLDLCFDRLVNSSNYEGAYWIENDGTTSNWPLHTMTHFGIRPFKMADINGDGAMDLYAHTVGEACYTLNDGNGIVQDQRDLCHVSRRNYVRTDLNGDGLLDCFGTDTYKHSVFVILQSPNGGFKTQKTLYRTTQSTIYIRGWSDFDGDGDIDIIILDDGVHYWIPNEGNQYFSAAMSFDIGQFDRGFYDLNGDSIADYLTTETGQPGIGLMLGSGAGDFTFAQQIGEDLGEEHGFWVADFDGDSDLDMIYAIQGSDFFAVLQNDGTGHFTQVGPLYERTSSFLNYEVVDFEGDGDLDLMLIDSENSHWFELDDSLQYSQMHLLKNIYDGTVEYTTSSDINNDLHVDLIRYDGGVQYNMGYNTFSDPFTVVDSLPPYDLTMLPALDLNSDGYKELLHGYSGSTIPPSNQHGLFYTMNLGHVGCTDPLACNYDPEVLTDNGSCCYNGCGCTIPLAENTDQTAICDDGSCVFEISGFVFRDINDSGELDASDIGLGYERVLLLPDSVYFTTDQNGRYKGSFTGNTPRTITVIRSDAWQNITTRNAYGIDVTDPTWVNGFYNFGFEEVTAADDYHHALRAGIESPGRHYPCGQSVFHEVYVLNKGNVTINARIDVTIDSEFLGYEAIDPVGVLNDSTFRCFANGLAPGELRTFKVRIFTPDSPQADELKIEVDYIGILNSEGIASGSFVKKETLNCMVEDNIIDATPGGYTMEHFIDGDELLRYGLEYKNTSGDIVDEIQTVYQLSPLLALDDLQFIRAANNNYCSVDIPQSLLICYKENANLQPESVDSLASFSSTIFEAKPTTDLAPGTVIEVSGDVVLDGTELGNSNYFHTIVDCTDFPLLLSQDTVELCLGEEVLITASGEFSSSISWSLDGSSLSTGDSLTYSSHTPLNSFIELITHGEVCSDTTQIPLYVIETLTAEMIGSSEFCEGDSTSFTSSASSNHEWYFNDELLSTENTVTLTQGGNLELVLNDGTCFSLPAMTTVIQSPTPSPPTVEYANWELSSPAVAGLSYQWFFEGELIDGATSNTYSPLNSGSYTLRVTNSSDCSSESTIDIIVSSLSESEKIDFMVVPNPMEGSAVVSWNESVQVTTIEILDSSGRIVRVENLNSGVNTHEIIKGKLLSGLYFLRLSTASFTEDIPLVVN